MADIKTHLRELSVAIGINYANNDMDSSSILDLSPSDFVGVLEEIISNNIEAANNILTLSSFTSAHISIINNGLALGKKIVDLNLCENYNDIQWLGGDTYKNDPIDLLVGQVGFSLKEESFILENMGLYKFINLLTNSNLPRGLHVFEYFAQREYNDWFVCTWNKLLNSPLPWKMDNGRYISEIKVVGNDIQFIYDGKVLSIIPAKAINIGEFITLTQSFSREKIFAKWISENLKTDTEYLSSKLLCSVKAGENLALFLQKNLNPINVSRFLQIYTKSYYYAKSTSNELSIFYVPSLDEFKNIIEITDISYSVPKSQLNIKTTISNTLTNKSLVIRNECRFSHGQFNGTPEAKMYYDRGHDLSVIYNKII